MGNILNFSQKSCPTEVSSRVSKRWLFVLQKGGKTWNMYHQ
nr:MAG TPA: hypothetical protein [Caudoviricetes sp.]DAI28025.1 MAG TPA: hypothetical protein [Caudoviricetes sp.]